MPLLQWQELHAVFCQSCGRMLLRCLCLCRWSHFGQSGVFCLREDLLLFEDGILQALERVRVVGVIGIVRVGALRAPFQVIDSVVCFCRTYVMGSVVLDSPLLLVIVIDVGPALLKRIQAHLALLHQTRPFPNATADRRVIPLVSVKPLSNLTLRCRADILWVLLSSFRVSGVNSY